MQLKQKNLFRKDVKLMQRRMKDIEKLFTLCTLYMKTHSLPEKNKLHRLKGKYAPLFECHIEPDWLLIFEIKDNEMILHRTGTHADLFR